MRVSRSMPFKAWATSSARAYLSGRTFKVVAGSSARWLRSTRRGAWQALRASSAHRGRASVFMPPGRAARAELPAREPGISAGNCRSPLAHSREPDHELTAAVRPVAGRDDGSAVRVDDLPDDRQADAEAVVVVLFGARVLYVQVEDPRQVLRRDSDALVSHRDRDLLLVGV